MSGPFVEDPRPSPRGQVPPVQAGDVLMLNDPDYLYGQGPLILSITKVGRTERLRDGDWLDLEGVELREDGGQIGQQPRQALVRITALRSGIRRKGET
jgi:hypothetical protein